MELLRTNRGDEAPGDWRERLDIVVEMMRTVSNQTDPQAMVREYGNRIQKLMPELTRMVAVSRRGVIAPKYKITRSSMWENEIDPWRDGDKLPTYDSGLLGELLYGDEPKIIGDLQVEKSDPAYEYFADQRSLIATPLFDGGIGLNMVVVMRNEPDAFDPEAFADWVMLSNLFGRATHNLVLSNQLETAYKTIDQELQTVEKMQRSLLPAELPQVDSLDLAAYYRTSQRAGGDYYDFFPLPDGRLGILIADVSGHGTPAAVMMAITHSIAHQYPGPPEPPGKVLEFVNQRLTDLYTGNNSVFVTAFYGQYDPATRKLTYAVAGHNPPRVKRCDDGSMFGLNGAPGLPMGIEASERYEEVTQQLVVGDQIIFYTDGITEAMNAAGEMYGTERLDGTLENCLVNAEALIKTLVEDVETFTEGAAPTDDRTVLVAKIR